MQGPSLQVGAPFSMTLCANTYQNTAAKQLLGCAGTGAALLVTEGFWQQASHCPCRFFLTYTLSFATAGVMTSLSLHQICAFSVTLGIPVHQCTKTFCILRQCVDRVFVLKGNHSCYGRTIEQADDLIAQVCAAYPAKLHYLNKAASEFDHDFVILGCTLWSHVIGIQRLMVLSMLADNHHITGWSVARNNEVHAAELAWLKSAIAKVEAAGKQAVVLTHHAPSCHGTSAPEHTKSPISSAFGSDLEYLLKPPVVLWMFGHTHYSSDQHINGVRVCSNQVGYPNDGVSFDPGFTVQLASPSLVVGS